MHGGLILRHTHRTAPEKARPWPPGVGLAIGATASLALWAGIIKLAMAALS
jgi:hypothetical protein